MDKGLRLAVCFLLMYQCIIAQVQPSENSILNYRLAGFSVPENTKAVAYLFQIAGGIILQDEIFDKKIILKQKSATSRSVITLPAFGLSYTWRVSYLDKAGKEIDKSELHHFSTGIINAADTGYNGLAIISNATHHRDLLLLLDGVFVIYDTDGKPVWYMPDIPGVVRRGIELRDFKATADGTFTFITPGGAYEVDYNGKIIWSAPNDGKISKEKTEFYHHELLKLSNGNYMVASAETIPYEIPADPSVYFAPEDTTVKKGDDGKYHKYITCGTLIEYDAEGNIAWYWKSSEHFISRDFFRPKKALSKPFDCRAYLNAFDVDEKNKVIYISFKNINRIVKIAYPSGKVLNSYGEKVNSDLSIEENSPFYGQHSCRIDKKTNNLYLYNNNCSDFKDFSKANMDNEGDITSHVVIYKQPADNKADIQKVWDFPCKLVAEKGKPLVSTRGGSVQLLDDDCVLISMGTLNHLMIISKDKKLVMDAAPYTTDTIKNKKGLIPYRVSAMHKKDIEKFIFRSSM